MNPFGIPETPMKPPPKLGTRLRIIANESGHEYELGEIVEVAEIGPGDLIRARRFKPDMLGDLLNTTEYRDANSLDWYWLAEQIPEADRAILSCFDGLHNLVLRRKLRDALVSGVPDLEEALRLAAR